MTKHLTYKEIADFLRIKDMDEDSLKLSLRVNSHMMNCKECRQRVGTLEILLEELAEEPEPQEELVMKAALVREFEREI